MFWRTQGGEKIPRFDPWDLQRPWDLLGLFPRISGLGTRRNPGGRPRLTSAGGQGAAPLAIGQALGLGSSFQTETRVALEFGHVVEVELGALGEPVGGVARVATGDGCKHKTEMLFHLFLGSIKIPTSIPKPKDLEPSLLRHWIK